MAGRGGAYSRVLDRSAGPRFGRARPGRGREGRGDRRAAPPVAGAAPTGCPAPLHAHRSARAGEVAAEDTLGGVPGHALDAAALAPRAGAPPLDLAGADNAVRPGRGHLIT